MDQNLVTIILPCYNGARHIEQAIKSVISQSFTNFELLVIDDGSSDESVKMIENFQDPRIRLIRHVKNLGLIETLNDGLESARGNLIARIDADDKWILSNKLEQQINYLENNQRCGLVGTWASAVDNSGKEIFKMRSPNSDKDIRRNMLIKNCFIHSTVLFRKEAAKEALGFNREELYVEDYGLWLRIGKKWELQNLPIESLEYLINSDGISLQNNLTQNKNSLKVVKINKSAYPNYWLGYIKWNLKTLILRLFGLSVFQKAKKWIKK